VKLHGYCSLCGTESTIEVHGNDPDSYRCCDFRTSTIRRYFDPSIDPSVWWIASNPKLGNIPRELTCKCKSFSYPHPLVFTEIEP
jgi:hypothetical protein